MSGRPFAPSRRAVAALALQGLLPWFAPWLVPSAARAAAQDPNDGADRGLGGTGARLADAPGAVPGGPDETLGQDRGIGGTGVIGTIRRFGSIVVNDLRVTFPPGVAVSIDGRRAAVRDLRLGHVVRVLARRRGGVLVTRAIVAESEVVGPVDAAGAGHLTVLGQRIVLAEGVAAPPRRAGARLAVSGLRRLDGAVVASLIEARPPGPDLLRGPVEAGADGKLAVGGLAVAGLDPGLLGRRVSLAGARRGGIFHPHAVTVEPRIPFAAAEAVSLEAYVARAPDGLRLGSGLDVSAEPDALAEVGEGAVRAVVLARPDASGRLDARSLHVEAGARGGEQGVPGRPAGPGEPALGRAEPGRPDAGRPDAGPRGGAGGGPGGSAGPGGAGGRGGPGGGGAGSGGRGGGPGR